LLPACPDSIPLFTVVSNVSYCDVLQNIWQSIWTSSLAPATLHNVFSMLSIWGGTFTALSADEGQIFLYGTKCFQSTRFSTTVRRCSVAIYFTGCNSHLKPTVPQGQVTLGHVQWGRYLYTSCRQNTNSCDLVLEEAQ